MGTGFDFTRLDDDFFLAAPDFSANAKLAASADLLPSGDYRFHILGSRFLGDRRCGHLGFDLIVCDGTFAGSHSDLSFYIYHPPHPHTPPRLRAHTVSAARLRPRRRAS